MNKIVIIPPQARDVRAGQDFINCWSVLDQHRRNRRKLLGYQRMLNELGIEATDLTPCGADLAALHERPRLIHAEQPGNWSYPDDVLRARLLQALRQKSGFDERSGLLTLSNDAFGHRDSKRYLIEMPLGLGQSPVNLVGSPFVRRHRRRSYAAIKITGGLYDRLEAILKISERFLEGVVESPQGFAREARVMLEEGIPSGLRSLFPVRCDRRGLIDVARRYADFDLGRAKAPISAARRRLKDGIPWTTFWNSFNEDVLGERVGCLESVINPFLLAIQDPFRTASALIRMEASPAEAPVALAGVVTAEDDYRLVCCDPVKRHLFLKGTARPDQSITWDEVREFVAAQRAGGPTAILKYLLMAARGIYVVADPYDGLTSFERRIAQIHLRYTGIRYPWVSLPRSWEACSPSDYLEHYQATFERYVNTEIVDFLHR